MNEQYMPVPMPMAGQGNQTFSNPSNSHVSSIVNLTNPEDELEKLELRLRCIRIDSDGNKVQYAEPLLNEEGINRVMAQISDIVNPNTYLSEFNSREIERFLEMKTDVLTCSLLRNKHIWGVKDSTVMNEINTTLLSLSLIVLKRAQDGSDKRFWKGSVQEFHNRIEQPNMPKKGFLSKMNPF